MCQGLKDRVALVTGASKGLGAAIAVHLAARGVRVGVNFHRVRAPAENVLSRIKETGGTGELLQYDVTDRREIAEMVEAVTGRWGPIDIVVNNATGPQPMMSIAEQTWEDHLDQLRFFVKAPLEILQAVVPEMKARKYGRIINIGSEVVELGSSSFGHYVAAKGAMLGLTRSWARELGPHGITVNLVAPGFIPVERHAGTAPATLEAYSSRVSLGRQGVPEDVAGAVAFLAGDGAKFITGQKVAVNGGNTLL